MKSLTMWLAVLCFSFILTGCKNEAKEPEPAAPAQHDAPPEHEAENKEAASDETPEEEKGPALVAPNEGGSEAEGGSSLN